MLSSLGQMSTKQIFPLFNTELSTVHSNTETAADESIFLNPVQFSTTHSQTMPLQSFMLKQIIVQSARVSRDRDHGR